MWSCYRGFTLLQRSWTKHPHIIECSARVNLHQLSSTVNNKVQNQNKFIICCCSFVELLFPYLMRNKLVEATLQPVYIKLLTTAHCKWNLSPRAPGLQQASWVIHTLFALGLAFFTLLHFGTANVYFKISSLLLDIRENWWICFTHQAAQCLAIHLHITDNGTKINVEIPLK